MASKWNAVPVAALPGLAFLAVRVRSAGWRCLTARRGPPIGGMTLAEAAVWLGLLPVAVYALTFAPYAILKQGAVGPTGLLALHQRMLTLQEEVLPHHTYQSVWYEWVLNWRAIWYLYEPIDGAQRGVLMVGNPLTMLIGLPAVVWCAWTGVARQRWDALAVFALYVASLGLWVVAAKAVQFYYHYMLSSVFLIAALALALDALRRRGWRWLPRLVIAVSSALFVFFWPILTAAPLGGHDAFLTWTWLHSWR
jgi:hypothetical protein